MPTPRCWPDLATDPNATRGDWRLYLLWPIVLAVGVMRVLWLTWLGWVADLRAWWRTRVMGETP